MISVPRGVAPSRRIFGTWGGKSAHAFKPHRESTTVLEFAHLWFTWIHENVPTGLTTFGGGLGIWRPLEQIGLAGCWMDEMPQYKVDEVDPRRSALIVVDMQSDFLAVGAPFESAAGRAMIPQLKRAINFCREREIPVIYTAHVHRRNGCDMGLFRLNAKIAGGTALSEGEPGAAIYAEIAPKPDELVIKKHRFSAFYGTDLELVLRGLGVDTVIICGVTTENCCHATARDAMFRDFKVIFLSDATGSVDYADAGQGALSAAEVHQSTLVILSQSTADVVMAEEFFAKVRANEPRADGNA